MQQRRAIDFTSTVALAQSVRLLQADSWDDPTLQPAVGAALDVRLALPCDDAPASRLPTTDPSALFVSEHASLELHHQVYARLYEQGPPERAGQLLRPSRALRRSALRWTS
jgi:hypothetical protein